MLNQRRYFLGFALLLVATFTMSFAGCGGGSTATLTGNVTAGGKAPNATAVSLVLNPVDGSAGTVIEVNPDGSFSGDAVIGTNKVSFVVYGEETGVAEQYTSEDSSPLTVDISSGTNTKDFEIGE